MHSLIEQNKAAINRLCRQYHIKSLYAFGNITNGFFNESSDVDFLYTIDTNNFPGWVDGEHDYTENLFQFEQQLRNLLKRDIDLIPDLPFQNKYFKKTIDRAKQLVYAA